MGGQRCRGAWWSGRNALVRLSQRQYRLRQGSRRIRRSCANRIFRFQIQNYGLPKTRFSTNSNLASRTPHLASRISHLLWIHFSQPLACESSRLSDQIFSSTASVSCLEAAISHFTDFFQIRKEANFPGIPIG